MPEWQRGHDSAALSVGIAAGNRNAKRRTTTHALAPKANSSGMQLLPWGRRGCSQG